MRTETNRVVTKNVDILLRELERVKVGLLAAVERGECVEMTHKKEVAELAWTENTGLHGVGIVFTGREYETGGWSFTFEIEGNLMRAKEIAKRKYLEEQKEIAT